MYTEVHKDCVINTNWVSCQFNINSVISNEAQQHLDYVTGLIDVGQTVIYV